MMIVFVIEWFEFTRNDSINLRRLKNLVRKLFVNFLVRKLEGQP